jgi:hypothetical protein
MLLNALKVKEVEKKDNLNLDPSLFKCSVADMNVLDCFLVSYFISHVIVTSFLWKQWLSYQAKF